MHKKAKNLPLPGGKGVGGDGGKKEGKGRGQQAAKKASHPFRHHSGKVNRQPKPPRPPAGDNSGKAGQATPAQAHVLFPISHTRGQNFSTTCGETCGETRRMVRRFADAQTVFALLRGFSARFDRRRGVEKTARRPETAPPPGKVRAAGQNTGGYRPHISRSISWYPSAAERLSAASACAQASTAADRTPGSAARATRRYSLT